MAIHRENIEIYDEKIRTHRAVKLTVKCPDECMEGLNIPWLSQICWDKGGSVVIEIKVEKLKRG